MESKDNEKEELLNENNQELEELENEEPEVYETELEEDYEEDKVEIPEFIAQKKVSKAKLFLGALKRIAIVSILLVISAFVLQTSKYYKNDDITDRTNVIINNNNVTAKSLKLDLIIRDDVIFMSMRDIKNYFDNYIYQEENTNKIITTYDENIAEVGFTGSYIKVNGTNKKVKSVAIKENEEIYLPISEMVDVYNIELEYIEETDIVTMDSIKREQIKAEVSKKVSVKDYARVLSRTVDKLKTGDKVIVISKSEEGWAKVRTSNGKIGFVKTEILENEVTVRESQKEISQINGPITMFWDYYGEKSKAPDMTGEYINGVNVVSPAFFYINKQGAFIDKVGDSAKKYIEWAHDNGYKVWPMFSNAEGGIKITSQILNSFEAREEIIEKLVDVCEKYKLDGINIDFEYMYEKDKDVFSRFIIELTPRMKDIGVVTSVDVTAPDGSPNWSLCYDRTVLGDTVDYLIFMAYDQYGTSSKTAGTTAGYNWVETNLKKFIETYEVPSEKIILGIPFYTRLWTETADGDLDSIAIPMTRIEKQIPKGVEKVWNETLKQYYVEFKSGSSTKKMWIEDEKSIAEKVSLFSKYNLAGVSAWEKDQATNDIWEVIEEELNK